MSGTEAIRSLTETFRGLDTAVELMTMVVDTAVPDRRRMLAAAEAHHVAAIAVSEELSGTSDLPFREVHHAVGALIGALEARGQNLSDAESIELGGTVHAMPGVAAPADAAAAML